MFFFLFPGSELFEPRVQHDKAVLMSGNGPEIDPWSSLKWWSGICFHQSVAAIGIRCGILLALVTRCDAGEMVIIAIDVQKRRLLITLDH